MHMPRYTQPGIVRANRGSLPLARPRHARLYKDATTSPIHHIKQCHRPTVSQATSGYVRTQWVCEGPV